MRSPQQRTTYRGPLLGGPQVVRFPTSRTETCMKRELRWAVICGDQSLLSSSSHLHFLLLLPSAQIDCLISFPIGLESNTLMPRSEKSRTFTFRLLLLIAWVRPSINCVRERKSGSFLSLSPLRPPPRPVTETEGGKMGLWSKKGGMRSLAI